MKIETSAAVHLGEGPTITHIDLVCKADVPGVSDEKFQEIAKDAKEKCPVSKVVAGAEISLDATLV